MSKIKKKIADRPSTTITEADIIFEKTIQFCGWIFLIISLGFLGFWGLFHYLLKIIEIEINISAFSFIIFSGISSAISFALSSVIKKNRDKKKSIFVDWIIAEFLFCMFAIFTVAAYQW